MFMDDVTSSWAQYTLCLNTENREEVQSALKEVGGSNRSLLSNPTKQTNGI